MHKRILGALAMAAAFAGVVGATATPATAASLWISRAQVLSIKNPMTAVAKVTPAGTVQVRHGTYGGKQYGWGRAVAPTAGYNLVFEVDTNGDRSRDDGVHWYSLPGGETVWIEGYPTSSSSKVAFRACITKHLECSKTTSGYRTAWW